MSLKIMIPVLLLFLVAGCTQYAPVETPVVQVNNTTAAGNNTLQLENNITQVLSNQFHSVGILTLKKQYASNEKFLVNLSKEVYTGHDSWSIVKDDAGKWKKVITECASQVNSIPCSEYNTQCGFYSAYAPPFEGCEKINSFTWNMKSCIGFPEVECLQGDNLIHWTCANYVKVSSGYYKIMLTYTEDCPDPSQFSSNTTTKTIEAEFEII